MLEQIIRPVYQVSSTQHFCLIQGNINTACWDQTKTFQIYLLGIEIYTSLHRIINDFHQDLFILWNHSIFIHKIIIFGRLCNSIYMITIRLIFCSIYYFIIVSPTSTLCLSLTMKKYVGFGLNKQNISKYIHSILKIEIGCMGFQFWRHFYYLFHGQLYINYKITV